MPHLSHADGAGGELLSPDSPAWRRALEGLPHDVYHLPAYVELEAARLEHRPAAFLFERDGRSFLLPLLLREIPGAGRLDCASPYGYPGPIADPDAGDDFLAAACRALVAALRDAGVVSAFVRFHPLLSPPAAPFESGGRVVRHGETVAIDLRRPEAEMWAEIRSGHRNEIHRARRQGLAAQFDEEWLHLDEFARLYLRTMERVGADQGYHFPHSYFRSLRRRLPGRVHLAVVRRADEVICAGLFLETGGIVQYHLSGTADGAHRHHPTKLLLDHARRWASERGREWLHLGGGLGGANDSLFAFKAGFSRLRLRFHTWRLIVDDEAYAELSRQRASGRRGDRPDDFFPAYRAG